MQCHFIRVNNVDYKWTVISKSRYMPERIWNHESMIRTLRANWDDTSRWRCAESASCRAPLFHSKVTDTARASSTRYTKRLGWLVNQPNRMDILQLSSKYLWVVVSNIFYFQPDPWGDDPIWRAYFSNGLVQPPPNCPFWGYQTMQMHGIFWRFALQNAFLGLVI